LLRQRANAEEIPILAAETDPARRAYLDERATLGTDQATLWTADIFTDDGAMLIVGAERVARPPHGGARSRNSLSLLIPTLRERLLRQ